MKTYLILKLSSSWGYIFHPKGKNKFGLKLETKREDKDQKIESTNPWQRWRVIPWWQWRKIPRQQLVKKATSRDRGRELQEGRLQESQVDRSPDIFSGKAFVICTWKTSKCNIEVIIISGKTRCLYEKRKVIMVHYTVQLWEKLTQSY